MQPAAKEEQAAKALSQGAAGHTSTLLCVSRDDPPEAWTLLNKLQTMRTQSKPAGREWDILLELEVEFIVCSQGNVGRGMALVI